MPPPHIVSYNGCGKTKEEWIEARREVLAKPGDEVEVRLTTIGSAGSSWSLKTDAGKCPSIKLVKHFDDTPERPTGMVGGFDEEVYLIKALQAGQDELRFRHGQCWDAKTWTDFHVKIVVE